METILKRDGRKVDFDKTKIVDAIKKSFIAVDGTVDEFADEKANNIADFIQNEVEEYNDHEYSVEEIQDLVEKGLMSTKRKDVARAYITYRNERNRIRGNTVDKTIEEIADGTSKYWATENSNKAFRVVTTQRDYFAGAVSEDFSKRKLLPKDIVDAHEAGIIHFHDMDYFAQNALNNCCLINLEDMLQNNTVINGVLIEKPHKFSTACTIATQIILGVSSSQYGGCTISLTHLAPFVRSSFIKYLKKSIKKYSNDQYLLDIIDGKSWPGYNEIKEKYPDNYDYAIDLTLDDINAGVQTFNYQVNSMTNTNGQSPFLSVFMYLGETEEYKKELALVIEEFLNQRILGFKNEAGVYVTPAFPKLLYVTEEDNIHPDSKYYYLTELAAKCTAKRMVPDYISEKIMKRDKIDENGNGNCYPCMGCLDGKELVTYKFDNKLFVESFERMWFRLSKYFPIKHQYDISNPNLYIDLSRVEIFDTNISGFTECRRIIRNISNKWMNVTFSNGRQVLCTIDHPFEVIGKGVVQAINLSCDDEILINNGQYSESYINFDPELAWTLGVLICDSSYASTIAVSLGAVGEDDIIERFSRNIKTFFNLDTDIILRERGVKGTYNDLLVRDNEFDSRRYLYNDLYSMFEGGIKNTRHIPVETFSWSYEAKIAFLAGMIDADGYINDSTSNHGDPKVQIGSVNKELALQQLALAQSLGMPAKIYTNHYDSNNITKIRYRVEFVPSYDLVEALACKKKKDHFHINPLYLKDQKVKNYNSNICKVTKLDFVDKLDYSYDVTTASEHFEVSGIYSHNCRSFLSTYLDNSGKPKYYGRLNVGVVTLNLPDIALSSNKDINKFWKLIDERTELCHKALRIRYDRVANATSDAAPILWQHGALARLQPGEKLGNLIKDNYATASLGYAGLYECVLYMTGMSHSSGKGKEFALEVMKYLNDKCDSWKNDEKIGYSLYGTPLESTTYKFAKCMKKRFGEIKDITDRGYITNSYHICVREEIDAFSKLAIESEFQKLSPGGCISYVEVPNMQNNPEAVIDLIKFMYDNIMYAEINTKSDYCRECGYDGEIEIKGEAGDLYWECPRCGCHDQTKLDVRRRTCGYIGSNFWNQGRTEEIKDRVLHL